MQESLGCLEEGKSCPLCKYLCPTTYHSGVKHTAAIAATHPGTVHQSKAPLPLRAPERGRHRIQRVSELNPHEARSCGKGYPLPWAHRLEEWLPYVSGHQNHLSGLWKHRWKATPRLSHSSGLEWVLRICISHKLLGDPSAAAAGTTCWEASEHWNLTARGSISCTLSWLAKFDSYRLALCFLRILTGAPNSTISNLLLWTWEWSPIKEVTLKV